MVNAIGDIEVWDLANDRRLQTLTGHRDRIIGLEWSGAADRLLSADEAGRLLLWDASTAKQLAEFDAAATLVQIAASRNGRYAASIDAAGKVLVVQISEDRSAMNRIDDVAGDVGDADSHRIWRVPMLRCLPSRPARGCSFFHSIRNSCFAKSIMVPSSTRSRSLTTKRGWLPVVGTERRDCGTWLTGSRSLTMEGDPQSRLLLAKADRDTARQTASVERLKKQTEELEKILAARTRY